MVKLVWDHKYDESGNIASPLQIALPFQTIETLNESSQQRQKSIDSFLSGRVQTEWRNRLIWGDKKYVLPSLLTEFANSIDLIYIDPPFGTGADFSYLVEVPDHDIDATSFNKLPSIIELKAYRDTWGDGPTQLDSYLRWFNETLRLLEKLLKSTGSIFIHLDSHLVHYVKAMADEVFGTENFRSEIIWQRTSSHNDPKNFGNITDYILYYTKSNLFTWNPQHAPFSKEYIDTWYRNVDEKGRRYMSDNLASPHPRPNLTYAYKGFKPPAYGWKVSLEVRRDSTKKAD